jgi:hypothetical protein
MSNGLHWYWGSDRRRCADCHAEVYAFEEGMVCSGCGKTEDDAPASVGKES